MGDAPKPKLNRGMILGLALAVAGAAIIGFAFVPLMSPDTDVFTAFGVALAFMLIAMAAGYAAKGRL